jgi:hypothetical protein
MTEAVSSGTRYDSVASNNLSDTNSNVPYESAVMCGSRSINMAKFSATTGVLKAGTNLTAATNTAWSMSLWFYAPTDPGRFELVHASGSGQYDNAITFSTTGSVAFLFSGTGGETYSNPGSNLALNTCHNLIISYTNNSTAPSFYLDGSSLGGLGPITGGFTFNLFMNDDGNDYAPSGSYLGQVAWFSGTALSSGQATTLYNSGTPQVF